MGSPWSTVPTSPTATTITRRKGPTSFADSAARADMAHSVIVTGAGGGLGAAMAKVFSENGWSVVLVDRDPDAVAREAAALPGAIGFAADVSDETAVDRAVAAAEAHCNGPVDALVNN